MLRLLLTVALVGAVAVNAQIKPFRFAQLTDMAKAQLA